MGLLDVQRLLPVMRDAALGIGDLRARERMDKTALLRARVVDVRAFAADPALAWSALSWRRGRGWLIAE
jgi:hypothetical protein